MHRAPDFLNTLRTEKAAKDTSRSNTQGKSQEQGDMRKAFDMIVARVMFADARKNSYTVLSLIPF